MSKWEWPCRKMLINSIPEELLSEGLRDHPLGCNGSFNIVPSALRVWHTMGTQHMSEWMNEWIHLFQLLALHVQNPVSPTHLIGSSLTFRIITESFSKDFCLSVLFTNVRTKRRSHEMFWTLKFNGNKRDLHTQTLQNIEMKCEHLKCRGGKTRLLSLNQRKIILIGVEESLSLQIRILKEHGWHSLWYEKDGKFIPCTSVKHYHVSRGVFHTTCNAENAPWTSLDWLVLWVDFSSSSVGLYWVILTLTTND